MAEPDRDNQVAPTGDAAPNDGGDNADNDNNTSTSNGNQQQQQQQPQSVGSQIMGMISRMLFFYFIYNTFFKKSSTPVANNSPVNVVDPETGVAKALGPLGNVWPDGVALDLRMYLTNDEFRTPFNEDPVWHAKELYYDWRDSNKRAVNITFSIPEYVLNNETMYAHIHFTQHGYMPDKSLGSYHQLASFRKVYPLVRHLPRPKKVKKENLLSGEAAPIEAAADVSEEKEKEIIPFWCPTLALNLVTDATVFTRSGIPPQIVNQMHFTADNTGYYPTPFVNEFWLMREHLFPVNETLSNLFLNVTYEPISLFKWQMYSQMTDSFKMQTESLGSSEREVDEMKRMFLETNPWLLALTFAVTLLHSVFDFLAFKNDIAFWKNKKSMEGMSVRSLFISVVMQFVVFLYLIDNETSMMIIVSSGIGLLIECWKIKKACNVTVDTSKFPYVHFEDKDSYTKSKTKEYDQQAMKYLSYVLYPMLFCYAIYSLVYDTHKSWYSYILGTAVGAVYTFGFVLMTPQLFINYKLKSVAHLPWRTFVYKALNTFIDDLFAFIIKMPSLHRLACFRDDIIFLIYLYQRWVYRVDMKRVNEFGQGGASDDEASGDTAEGDKDNLLVAKSDEAKKED